jgi:hypothetical protein
LFLYVLVENKVVAWGINNKCLTLKITIYMKRKIKMLLLSSLVIFSSNEVLKAQNWLTSGNTLTGTLPSSPNEYIGSTNNANLRFLTNSSVNMVITSTGKIGMGVGAPVYGLELGNLSSAGSLSSGGSFLIGLLTEGSAAVGNESVNKHAVFGSMTTNKDILFPTYNGTSFDERMRITSSGDVGIGTSSPANKLDVLATTPIVRVGISSGTTSYAAFTAHDISANTSLVQLMGGSAMGGTLFGASRAGLGQFYTNSAALVMGTIGDFDLTLGTNNTARVTIRKSTGNVGIGTVVPASKLDVEGGVAIGASYSGSSAAPTDGAIIQGNVGVGTTAPAAKLDVTIGGSTSSTAVKGTNTSTGGTNYGGYFTATGSSATANIGLFVGTTTGATSNYELYISNISAGANNYSIYNPSLAKSHFAGDVGIGTTAPGYLLEVNGNAAKPGGGSWTNSSDIRVKKDTSSFKDGLSVIKKIHPVNYRYNGKTGIKDTTSLFVGVIAQQIQPIAPYTVGTYMARLDTSDTQDTQLFDFNSGPLLFVAINAIKQLDSINSGLVENDSIKESQIQALEAKDSILDIKLQEQDSIISSLQNQINQLVASINNCCNNNGNGNGNGGGNGNGHNHSSINGSGDYKSIPITTTTSIELNNKNVIVLDQNAPNPFAEQTSISYYLPNFVSKAQIVFYEQTGKILKTVDLTEKGNGVLNIFASDLTSGFYTYSLIIDGQVVETKKMVKQ